MNILLMGTLIPPACVCRERSEDLWCFRGKWTPEILLCPKTALGSTRLSIYSFTLSGCFVCESIANVVAIQYFQSSYGLLRTPLHSHKEKGNRHGAWK